MSGSLELEEPGIHIFQISYEDIKISLVPATRNIIRSHIKYIESNKDDALLEMGKTLEDENVYLCISNKKYSILTGTSKIPVPYKRIRIFLYLLRHL
jgi:hypothetical protein